MVNVLRLAREVRHYMSMAIENTALKAQLAAVGEKLTQARRPQNAAANLRATEYAERRSLVLVPKLLEMLDLSDKFLIVDAGAREVDRDPRWRPFPPERLSFIGFEPDKEEAARLNAESSATGLKQRFVAAGLWRSSGARNFEHNNIGGGSSFLPQNRNVTDRWKFENPAEARHARDIFFPVRTEQIEVVGLADWARDAQVGKIDFLKLNVQGAEREILIGAGEFLDDILGILVEVSFVESYRERPMFVDIDVMLRERGFSFFDLLAHHYVGRAASPISAQHLVSADGKLSQLVSPWGQLIEGHALYFRDPIGDKIQLSFERVVKLAALAEAFGQVEFAFELLVWCSQRTDVAEGARKSVQSLIDGATVEYRELLRPGL
jgi:FkbM family methyltransferase